MKQSPSAGLQIPGTDATERTVSDTDTLTTMLGALEDADCRAILAATNDTSLSASELSETCELPLSTTYRKLDTLTDAGLLEENIRISSSGKHASEYELAIENLQLSVDSDDGVQLQISECDSSQPGTSLVASAD